MTKLLFPSTLPAPKPIPGIETAVYQADEPLPEEHLDAQILAVWDTPRSLLKENVGRLKNLEYLQFLSSGVDAFTELNLPPSVVVAGGRSLHDMPVAEHTMGLLLAAARSFPALVRAQIGHRWAEELGGSQPDEGGKRFTTLDGANVLIWGYGSIGRQLNQLLKPFGANVTGVATTARQDGDVSVHTTDDLPGLLEKTDVLVMILPKRASTDNALNSDVLKHLPRHAWVVNVGRGSTVDEEALLVALNEHKLAGAMLDVTQTEPLPVDSPLWDHPNIFITPHAAGGRPRDFNELLQSNIAAWRAGAALQNQVDTANPDAY